MTQSGSRKLLLNSFGAMLTFIVMIVFAVTKFQDGAWIVVFLIPTLVLIFFRIHLHYRIVAKNLSLETFGEPHRILRNRVLVLIGGVHRGVLHAMRYARSLSDDITAVYVAVDPVETEKLIKKWQYWGDGVRLKIIESPYRRLVEPCLRISTRCQTRSHHFKCSLSLCRNSSLSTPSTMHCI